MVSSVGSYRAQPVEKETEHSWRKAYRWQCGTREKDAYLLKGFLDMSRQKGVHPRSPHRDIFRLSNDPEQGFNQVGPEWHNDGSFCREVFSHVAYHIIKAPSGHGDTCFAHLGAAYDTLPSAEQERYRRCASVNSNGGAVHPLVFDHPISGYQCWSR